jgi:penicillin-insensitive murein DD-endopeptidase
MLTLCPVLRPVLPVPHLRPAAVALAVLTATSTLSAGALPRTASRHFAIASAGTTAGLGPAALRFGRSLGSPTDGHLVGGMHLDETTTVRVVPADISGDVRWGLQPLVTMLERGARAVRRQFPGTVTSVGHLSREGGGSVEQHRSHESGRDADVGFFVRSAAGAQLLESHFVRFKGDGTAVGWPGAYFDEPKNWALVSALLSDPQAHVTHIFISAPLRGRLLGYAEKIGAPSALRVRAAEILQQPHGTLPHDDHFHVRIACPSHMSGCVENPFVRSTPTPPSRPIRDYGRRGPPADPESEPLAPLPSEAAASIPMPSRPRESGRLLRSGAAGTSLEPGERAPPMDPTGPTEPTEEE